MNAKDGDAEFSPVWRAQLNLIFAIGAKFSHTIDADWAADTRDHLIYMKRAVNLLEMEDTLTIISGPNVPLVQTVSILSDLYFTRHTTQMEADHGNLSDRLELWPFIFWPSAMSVVHGLRLAYPCGSHWLLVSTFAMRTQKPQPQARRYLYVFGGH